LNNSVIGNSCPSGQAGDSGSHDCQQDSSQVSEIRNPDSEI